MILKESRLPGCFRGEIVRLKAELEELKRTMSVH
jgi:hypothetical protein